MSLTPSQETGTCCGLQVLSSPPPPPKVSCKKKKHGSSFTGWLSTKKKVPTSCSYYQSTSSVNSVSNLSPTNISFPQDQLRKPSPKPRCPLRVTNSQQRFPIQKTAACNPENQPHPHLKSDEVLLSRPAPKLWPPKTHCEPYRTHGSTHCGSMLQVPPDTRASKKRCAYLWKRYGEPHNPFWISKWRKTEKMSQDAQKINMFRSYLEGLAGTTQTHCVYPYTEVAGSSGGKAEEYAHVWCEWRNLCQQLKARCMGIFFGLTWEGRKKEKSGDFSSTV